MRRGLLVVLILLGLVLAPAAAFAQDVAIDLPVACGDLSEEDCTFLEESSAAMQNISSYSMSMEMAVALTNVPGLPADLSVDFAVDGAFSADPEVIAAMTALQLGATDEDDPMATFDALMAAVVDFYATSAFDLTMSLNFSRDIGQLLQQSAGVPVPESITLPMRLVDGFFYMNMEGLADYLQGEEELQGWIGFDIATMMAESVAQMNEQMGEGEFGADPSLAIMSSSMQINAEMMETFNEFTAVERLDDDTVDGTDVARFRWDFDLAGFAASPAFADMIGQQVMMQLQMQEAMGQEMPVSEADLQSALSMLPMIAPMLLSNAEVVTESSIGLEDKLVYESETNVNWGLGTVLMMAAAAQGAAPTRPQAGADAPNFEMVVRSSNAGFGEEIEVEVPEDAQIIPLDEMQSSSSM